MIKIKENSGKFEQKESGQKTNSICLASITSAHGLRGQVKIKVFADDPLSLTDYDNLYLNEELSGSPVKISKIKDTQKGDFIVSISGVNDRETAESLRGKGLYINRDDLPEIEDDEDEFYYHDLVGCEAFLNDEQNTKYGKVKAIFNFGSDDLIEITKNDQSNKDDSSPNKAKSIILSFSRENVPVVDIKNQKIILDKDAVVETEEMDNNKQESKNKKQKPQKKQ